jgi:phenylalanyl-tRNA synthetase beta chain
MQFPESWLREFCNPKLNTQELAHVLTMGGFEVEEVAPVATPFTGVVVGEIKEAVQHPNADRLRVCQVDVGTGTLLNIVCGAPNARVGIRIPCATVGALLPPGEDGKPFAIKLGKLRGIESQGMLCSAKELKISEESNGLLELPLDAPVGQSIRDYLKLDDQVFTIKLTPNLCHALSVYGVARELAALTGAELNKPSFAAAATQINDKLAVKVVDTDLCGRFSGRVIKGVNTQAKTPQWMVDKLARCGQRSVTALVDISNYVMFEFGRPTHIFDLDKISGGLTVRWAKAGESLKLLNGNTVELDEKVGIIADDTGVESLAGIMGGDHTAVSDDTRNVYVEAAFWWPEAVAGRSRRFNFATDAGHRFERGVDASQTVEHIEHITRLILEICGTPDTKVGPMDDQSPALPVRQSVTLRVARAAQIIGMPLTQAQCAEVFTRCGFVFSEGQGTITVTPPAHRFDITIEEDLIEEIARVVGFDALPNTPPVAPVVAQVRSEKARSKHAVRHALAALGYWETINFSFVEERWETELAGNTDPIRLLNPIASQMSVMRSTLIGSLIGVLKHNLDRKASRVRVFEIGRAFMRDASVATSDSEVKGVRQPLRVAGLAYGSADTQQWGEKEQPVDFYDVKGDVEALLQGLPVSFAKAEHPALHPGRSAAVLLAGQRIGVIGELHPQWRQGYDLPLAPVVFELDMESVGSQRLPVYESISRHQAVERDLAIVVAEAVTHEALMSAIRSAKTDGLLRDAVLFDVYRPKAGQGNASLQEGEKSLAVRLTLGSMEATLTDAQIDAAVQAVVASLESRLGAKLRA